MMNGNQVRISVSAVERLHELRKAHRRPKVSIIGKDGDPLVEDKAAVFEQDVPRPVQRLEDLEAAAALRLLHAQQGGAEESEISAGGQVLVTNREMLVTNREIRGTAGGREALVTNLTTNWAVVANREAVVTNRQAVLTPLRDVAAVVAASLRDVVRATEAGIDAAEDTLGYAHQTLNPKP